MRKASPCRGMVAASSLMDDLKRIFIRVEDIGGVVSGMGFQSRAWRDIVPRAGGGAIWRVMKAQF